MTATIIFCDITGFSNNEDALQIDLIRRLSAEVTRELYHRLSEPEPSVIFLPTGDGIAIALLEPDKLSRSSKVETFQLVDALMRFATSNQSVPDEGGLRIGVHHGPIVLVRDINRQLNICGLAVNYCQRIMDAAHPNQVLVSEEAFRCVLGARSEYRGEPFTDGAPVYFSEALGIPAKHGLMLHMRVMSRRGQKGWEEMEPFRQGTIVGKTKRTDFIVARLREMMNTDQRHIIYEQSAFTTFGITENPERDAKAPDYGKSARDQKKLLAQLAEQARTELYLLIRPIRAYDRAWRKARMDALLDWARLAVPQPNIRFAITDEYEGPNRLIVEKRFSIEGYKVHDTSGFELSIVKTNWSDIQQAIAAFHRVFDKRYQSNEATLAELERKREELSKPEAV